MRCRYIFGFLSEFIRFFLDFFLILLVQYHAGALGSEIHEPVADIVLTDAIGEGMNASLGPGLASNMWFSELGQNGGSGS